MSAARVVCRQLRKREKPEPGSEVEVESNSTVGQAGAHVQVNNGTFHVEMAGAPRVDSVEST